MEPEPRELQLVEEDNLLPPYRRLLYQTPKHTIMYVVSLDRLPSPRLGVK